MIRQIVLSWVCVTWSIANAWSQGQTPEQLFGQNRVQYKDFVWSYYQTDRFIVYFYLGGQDIGKFTIVDAEKEMTDIEQRLEYKMNERIEILVYNHLDDLKQTNIGYGVDQNNTGGLTKVIGNKMFIYFDGNHQHLRKQIREGIAGIFLQNMMFGGTLGEAVQNAVLLKLPPWFKEGLTSYIAQPWSTENDNLLKDAILNGRYEKLNKLTGADARFAGHAVWNYIALKYGESAIPNLLYLIRINRSMESGFTFVFNKSVNSFIDEFRAYFQVQYAKDEASREMADERNLVTLKNKSPQVVSQLRINNDAAALAFVKNKLGRHKVCLRNLETGKNKTIFRGGFKNITQPIDYIQPLLDFNPSGKELTMIYWRRNKTRVLTYNLEDRKKEKRDVLSFQKVFSFTYIDANSIALSAMNRGQSDIYTFNLRSSKLEQITNDYFDDLEPQFVKLPTRQGIFFASNRTSDTLKTLLADTTRPIGNFNLYFYNSKKKSRELLQVTQTRWAQELLVTAYDGHHFSFLSDQNGITNRYAGYIDSLFDHFDRYYFFRDSLVVNPAYNLDSLMKANGFQADSVQQVPVYRDTAIFGPQTNYTRSILDQDAALRAGKIAQLIYQEGRYQVSIEKIKKDTVGTFRPPLAPTEYAKAQWAKWEPATTIRITPDLPVPIPGTEADSSGKETSPLENYFFQSEFQLQPQQVLPENFTGGKKNQPFRFSRILPYSVKFSTAYVVTQLDNSLIVTRYQPFNSYGGTFDNPDLNVFLNVSITDLLEDYRISGGFRFPTAFDGTEYFFTFEDLKHRLDKKFTVYRKSTTLTYDYSPQWYLQVNAKVRTYVADASLKYPLDLTRSFRGSLTLRSDRTNYLATDSFSLGLDQNYDNWISGRLEYVFDNTMKIQTNIYDGLRYKFYGDAQRQIDNQNTYLFTTGMDVRYYFRIHRNFILATRLNGATSFGDQKVVYYLGAAENQFFPEFNQETPVDMNAGYAFQTLATNMRGFQQNVRNGNSFALMNAELRFPVFSFLLNTPIRSELVKNFQLNAFMDAGTAWQGLSPYDKDNPFNSIDVTQGPISVHVNYFLEPIVYGYGLGARTTVLGYFLRLDYARGIDSGAKKKPLWHFSMGLDF